ncbi:MAG: hypothetical protein ACYCOU_04385 [Sulfobacillus sp.]
MDDEYDELILEGIAKGKRPDISRRCVFETVRSHDQVGGNYEWLAPYYGKLLWVDFQEPVGTGKWRTYDRYWWSRHAAVCSHDPEVLVEEHVRLYVDPSTRRIALRFFFERPDGKVVMASPTRRFYELERDYFVRFKLCKNERRSSNDNP